MSANGTIVAGSGWVPDNTGQPGVVRVYKYNSASDMWYQIGQDLVGEMDGDNFGTDLSLSAYGNILAVGAPRHGSQEQGQVKVYEFDRTNNLWQQLGQNLNGEIQGGSLGSTVSLSADGETLASGAPLGVGNGVLAGRAYVYRLNRSINSWELRGAVLEGEADLDCFGFSLDISANGNTLVVGGWLNDENGNNVGHVRVFEHTL